MKLVLVLYVLGLLPAPTSAAQPPIDPLPGGDAAHLQQLQTCREGILDSEARPADRRRWADLLLTYESPAARSLVVELLSNASRPDVQRAFCEAIPARARKSPAALDPVFLDPLMELLAAEQDDLRRLAAQALAEFPGTAVSERLGAVAADPEAPVRKRLAAIDALAPNAHRRDVAGQLVSLLDSRATDIIERVVAALEPATTQDFGLDLPRWRQWWAEMSRLDAEAWLSRQLQIHRDRARRLEAELNAYREETQRDRAALTERIGNFQRELFRAINDDQRDAKLVQWLGSPLPVIQLGAIGIIKTRIADEGLRPSGEVLKALLGLLNHSSPGVRRDVLEIVQNLSEPAVVDAVLERLKIERHTATRCAILRAIGKLKSRRTLSALIREIANPDTAPDCVQEAATALGAVASDALGSLAPAQTDASPSSSMSADADPEGIWEKARAALKQRYARTPPEDSATRAALLTAMAGVGPAVPAAFREEFLLALESSDPVLLRPAIQGVRATRDRSKLTRLKALTSHEDPVVRLEAVRAVGMLGREDADLETLVARLSPAVEASELTRRAAWDGIREILSGRPVAARLEAAERLRDLPEYHVRYLRELADSLSGNNGNTDLREKALDQLAGALAAAERYSDAAEPLTELYELRAARSGPTAFETGLRLLGARLRAKNRAGLGALIRDLAERTTTEEDRSAIVATVADYADTANAAPDDGELRSLMSELSAVPKDVLGDPWIRLVDRLNDRVRAKPAPGTSIEPDQSG